MGIREDQGLDLRRYLQIFFRWWWVIFLVATATGVAGYLISSSQTSLYRAGTTILAQQSQTLAPTLTDLQTSQQLAHTYQELLTTGPILQQVIDQEGLPFDVGTLRGMVSASTVRNTQLLRIEATNENPQRTATIANALAQVFIQDTQNSRLSEIARLQAIAAAQGAVGGEEILQA